MPNNRTVICPVCRSNSFIYLCNAFSKPDNIRLFHETPENFLMCNQCFTIIKAPLIERQKDFTEYGKIYYNQMGSDSSSIDRSIVNHIYNAQIPVYKTCLKFLERRLPSGVYNHWLDIGSAGVPTSFSNYNFTTIEPDSRTVKIGKEMFNPGKIHCTVLEQYSPLEPYDGLLFHHSFYCLPNPEIVLQKARSIVKDNGIIVIAISHFCMATSPVFEDSKYLRIEDIFRGDTLCVYYNPFSLIYLMQRNGFVFEDEELCVHRDHPHAPHYSSKYFIFRKTDCSFLDHELLSSSRDFQERLFLDQFSKWHIVTEKTLHLNNTPKTIFIGDFVLFEALNKIVPLTKIKGFINVSFDYTNTYSVNGVKHLCLEDLSLSDDCNLVLCSFDKQKEILDKIGVFNPQQVQIPTRQSKIKSLYFDFNNHRVMTKEFSLRLYQERC